MSFILKKLLRRGGTGATLAINAIWRSQDNCGVCSLLLLMQAPGFKLRSLGLPEEPFHWLPVA